MTDSGIDMEKSGWEKAAAPAPARPDVAAPAAETYCDVESPDGWVCDRRPHTDGNHQADIGESLVKWTTGGTEVVTPRSPSRSGQATRTTDVEASAPLVLAGIGALVDDALTSQYPAAWVSALQKIKEILDSAS